MRPGERPDPRAVAGERKAVAERHPQDRHQRRRGEALRHGGEHVLLAHHAGIEQCKPRDRHHQDDAGGDDHPGRIGAIDLGGAAGGLTERGRAAQRQYRCRERAHRAAAWFDRHEILPIFLKIARAHRN